MVSVCDAVGSSVGRSAPCCFWPGSVAVEWAAVAGSFVEGFVVDEGSMEGSAEEGVIVDDGSVEVEAIVDGWLGVVSVVLEVVSAVVGAVSVVVGAVSVNVGAGSVVAEDVFDSGRKVVVSSLIAK